jgi:hypothetical protein
MTTTIRADTRAPTQLGFLIDELRSAGVTTYADLAATLNSQGIRPFRGRWKAHDLYLLMRRHRRAHPSAAVSVGATLYARRAEEARRVMRRLKRGIKTQEMIARALNARGLTTPGARAAVDSAQRVPGLGCWAAQASKTSPHGKVHAPLIVEEPGTK